MYILMVNVTFGAPPYSNTSPSHEQRLHIIEEDDSNAADRKAREQLAEYAKGSGKVSGSILIEVASIPFLEGYMGSEWENLAAKLMHRATEQISAS
jgi:hypothetical protein